MNVPRPSVYMPSRVVGWALVAAAAAGQCARPDRGSDLAASLPVRTGLNVIVVTFDALRADALGLYGYRRPTSPHLDEFARRSLVFERAYTTAPVTPTAFASMFTGRWPWRVFQHWKLADVTTLAQVFGRAGYFTAALLNNEQLAPERFFNRGFHSFELFPSTDDGTVLNRALTWLDEHRSERVCVWIHFLAPHAPYTYREDARHLYDPTYAGRFERTSGMLFRPDAAGDLDRIRSLYDGEVHSADATFGRLLTHLEQTGWLERSLVVVTSDHGEQFNEHGDVQHSSLHDETVRVPLIVFHPSGARGQRTALPYSHADLLPTLAAITGIDHREPTDGRDLLHETDGSRAILAIAMTDKRYLGASLRQGTAKLIVRTSPTREVQLFELERDPSEKENLAKSRPDLVGMLSAQLERELGPAGLKVIWAPPTVDPMESLDPERRERLKSLGYLGGR